MKVFVWASPLMVMTPQAPLATQQRDFCSLNPPVEVSGVSGVADRMFLSQMKTKLASIQTQSKSRYLCLA